MSAVIDGNVYQIQFRLHDNRYANSPKAVRVGGGYYRSDLLSLGEPGFDPVRYVLSIGIGATKGLSVISGDQNGNLRADKTPLSSAKNFSLSYNTIALRGVPVFQIAPFKASASNFVLIKNNAGTDVVRMGHGHMRAMSAMLLNIQSLLLQANNDTLTNQGIAALFNPPKDLTKLDLIFSEAYGNDINLLLNSEVFTGDVIDSKSVTNLALRSRDIDVATFSHVGVSSAKDTTFSVRADDLADEIVENTANSEHNIVQNITTIIANEPVTFHRKVRSKGRTRYRMSVPAAFVSASGASATFSLIGTGSVLGTTGGASARIIPLENGWFWVAFTVTSNTSASSALLTESILDESSNATYLGNGVSGLYLDELQVENGTIAHPPVDTTTAQVTATVKRAKLTPNVEENFDGSLTMSQLINLIGDPLANAVYLQKSVNVSANAKYCASAIVRKGTSPVSTLTLFFTGGATPLQEGIVTIDWATFAVTLTMPNSAWQGGLIPMLNGCYRLWVSGPAFDHTTLITRLYVRDKSSAHTYLEDVYVGSFMANKGYYPASYIKRGAS
jgi:hypothetical protein